MYRQLKTLPEVFRNSSDLHANHVAIDHEEGVITYSELHCLSLSFARKLYEIGVAPGDRVPLLTTHGTRNIVALMGILIVGACYVPMDRDTWSEDRIRTVLTTVEGSVIVNTTLANFEHGGYNVVHLQEINSLEPASETFKPPALSASNLACIIFTSGSTGKPKGVMIPHGAVVNYATTSPFNMDVGPGDRVLHILSVAFDACTGMLMSILNGGGTVVPACKIDLITKAQSCSIIACTPSILATLPLPNLKDPQYRIVHTVLLGGEIIPQELIDAWCTGKRRILNAYGPTETTCASLMHVIEPSGDNLHVSNAIIGKAMPNGPVHLLDSNMEELRECGQEGEIVISGPGVTHGYFRDEEKTRKSFIYRNGQRMYKTGDYGMWTKDGRGDLVIEFRGRRDRVVKNRGFLVNLDADIEAPMTSMGFGIQAIHVAQFRKKIVALVCPESVDTDSLRRLMLKTLSSFMIPDRILAVSALPMTANGKVDPKGVLNILEDRDDLIAMDQTSLSVAEPGSEIWLAVRDSARRSLGLGNNVVIEPSSNLFSYGASSLDILMFVSLCQTRGCHVSVQAVYNAQDLEEICKDISADTSILGVNDTESAARTQNAQEQPNGEQLKGIAKVPNNEGSEAHVPACAPMTPLQLELAGPTLAVDGKNTNQICIRYAIENAETIEQAWHNVWTTEPIFRTKLSLGGQSGGAQLIGDSPLTLPMRSTFSNHSEYRQALQSASICVGLGARLDIIRFIPQKESEHCAELAVIWTVHHSLVDGYAMAAILSKVEAAAAGVFLEEKTDSFMLVARRLLDIQDENAVAAKGFWSTYLNGVPIIETLGLPRPDVNRSDVAGEIRFSGAVAFPDLRRLASECQVTVGTVIYTAWAMMIAKYTDRDTVTVGAVVSGRNSPLISRAAVGPLINTLPLVVRFDSEVTVRDVLRQTLKGLAEISAFAWSTPQQINHRPTSLVALQFDYPTYPVTVPRLGVESFENTAFPLNLLVDEDGLFRLVYDPSVYEKSHARDMAEYFQRALQTMLKSQGRASSIPPTLPDVHKTLIMREWNPPSAPLNIPRTIQEAFDNSCRQHESLTAVEAIGESLTYRKLGLLANRVALSIRASFPPAKPVAIHADGSLNWIVGILGILKAGSSYCPLDPQYPLERRTAVCTAARAVGVLFPRAQDICGNRPLVDLPTLSVEEAIQDPVLAESFCFGAEPTSDALIVFTSGTTGTPKGVPISHRGLLALQSNPEATMFSGPGKRIAQMMSPAFDYCANEIFSALLHGATLVLRNPSDPYEHLKTVDSATLTPSLMAALDPEDYPSLQTMYATGEPVTPGLVQRWATGREFYNAYGPAEGSICVSFTRLVPGQPITIGRPIRTARMYILDRNRHHQPVGALGELYLAGVQVTRGYLNAEEQTKLRYIPDPWYPGEMMYRTGDFCRWTRDGQVFYVGRLDRQVKIRGFRVELPSVEQQIYAVDGQVILVSVLAMNDTLIAVVKPACIDVKKIKQELLDRLPPSWVPQRFVATDDFPLTQNKKIDMVSLQNMLDSANRREASIPDPAIEGSVAEIIAQEWRGLLKIQDKSPFGGSDCFTGLGGHSILQMLLSARLSTRFGIHVSLRDVLQADALRDLIELVKTRQSSKGSGDLPERYRLAPDALSPVEKHQWSEYRMASTTSTFNIPLVLKIHGEFSREALVTALNNVLAEHEIFRCNYPEICGGPRRKLRNTPPRVREQPVFDLNQEINHNFNVCDEELIRLHLWDDNFVLVISHMIADLTTLQNFFQDVSVAYKMAAAQSRSNLRDHLSSKRWEKPVSLEDSQFWLDYMRGAQHQVPLGKPCAVSRYQGQSEIIQVPPTLAKSLGHMARNRNITKHQLALAAVALTLRGVTLVDDLVLGAPCSSRFSASSQRAMGLLLDRFPVRIGKIRQNTSCAAFLSQVREASLAALAHVVPFPELLRILDVNPDTDRHPIFEVMVTFHLDQGPHEHLNIPDCDVSAIPVHASGSKFLLMFEWTEHSEEEWTLRIEYNNVRISCATLAQIKEGLFNHLNSLAGGEDITGMPV